MPPPSPRSTPTSSSTCTSRGLGDETASELIVGGFLAELVERVPDGAVSDALAGALEQRLGELLGD